jgi:hypothetical protein
VGKIRAKMPQKCPIGIGVFLLLIFSLCTFTPKSGRAQTPSTPIEAVVKLCVSFVHTYDKDDPAMSYFYKNFDAFYNSNTSTIQDNAYSVGDEKARFVFEKCMADHGLPLGPAK